MDQADIEIDYVQGYLWRAAWQRLANRKEIDRLQSKQERIEHRAILANRRVGRAVHALDAIPPVGTFEMTRFFPMSHPLKESQRIEFEAYVKLVDPHADLSCNRWGYENRDLQMMLVGWIAGRYCA